MLWYVAGIAGIILSSVWNYSVSNLFTWKMPRKIALGTPTDESEDAENV
jgi:hypothetical protein